MDQILGKSSEDVRPRPLRGGRNLTTEQRKTIDLSARIPGWGSDLDPAVRPGVPMDKAPNIGAETLYPDFEPQIPKHKVHKSVEHAKMPPVFGNVCPPRGLSGLIRDFAYGFSEGRNSHWILLLLADRIDVIEEIFVDIAHLRGPNVFKEAGLGTFFKYDRKKAATTATVVGVTAVVLLAFMTVRLQSPRS